MRFPLRVLWHLLCLVSPLLIQANMPAPHPEPGHLVGNGSFPEMKVIREDLFLDLTHLVDSAHSYASIYAKYQIDNPGPASGFDLYFIANNLQEQRFQILVDGAVHPGKVLQMDSVPDSWLPPVGIPYENDSIRFEYHTTGIIQFHFDTLSPGLHTIEVAYVAQVPEWHDYSRSYVLRNLVYILRPSGGWPDFGDFYYTIYAPERWNTTCNLPVSTEMVEDAATPYQVLSGHAIGLPHDYLFITTYCNPALAGKISYSIMVAGWVLGAILLFLLVYLRARYRAKKAKDGFWTNVWNNLICVSLAGMGVLLVFLNFQLYDLVFDSYMQGNASSGGYGWIIFFAIIVIPLFLILWFVVTLVEYLLFWRFRKRMQGKQE